MTVLFARNATAFSSCEKLSSDSDILALPEGFTCKVLSRGRQKMSDGYRTPGRPDGMACFSDGLNHVILARNHENYADTDPELSGGVSRIRIRLSDLTPVSDNLLLTGTARNCAGGISPWGWLSCEESTEPGHGYVYLCDPYSSRLEVPRKISAYGRFNHEAAVVDPSTHTAWLTEDRDDGCFYRFLPHSRESPFTGQLQALMITGEPGLNTGRKLNQGDVRALQWVDVDARAGMQDRLRYQAQENGAAIFVRGEGLWQFQNKIYFSCTSGGPSEKGQIFMLYTENNQEYLKVVSDTKSGKMDMPDNITVSPSGHLYIAEDGDGEQCVRLVRENGQTKTLARNILSGSEIAGICFDPLEETMFLNLQTDHLTVAVRGPFRNFTRNH